MREYGFLALALGTGAVFIGAYLLREPLERWHTRLEQDLARLRAGPSADEAKQDGRVD